MNSNWKLVRNHKYLSIIYLILVAAYLVQSLIVPADKSSLHLYHLTSSSFKLLILSIEIPYVVIWLIAFYGYLRLRDYANKIKQEKDGQGYFALSKGIFCLVIWLPISAILPNLFKQIYVHHATTTASLVRLNVYIDLLILLFGFYYIYIGSQKLLNVVSNNRFSASLPIILLFIVYSCFYMFLALHDPARRVPVDGVPVATYYEPDWLITLTVIIPRLCYWFLGIQAVYNLFMFRRIVKGKIYKDGMRTFALGVSGTVIITMLLRGLESVSTALTKLHLNSLIIIIYILLIIIAIAYLFIARGSRQLQRLEEL